MQSCLFYNVVFLREAYDLVTGLKIIIE